MQQLLILPGSKVQWTEMPDPAVADPIVEIRTVAKGISVGTELKMISQMRRAEDGTRGFGYSGAGVVTAMGAEASAKSGLKPGCRVACYGGPYVRHATKMGVPWTLVAPIADNVSMEAASMCGMGVIAMHSVRRGGFSPGERVVIYGMGILGQLQEQILRAWGCRTLALDRHDEHLELARRMGCERALHSERDDVESAVKAFAPAGIDGAIVNTNHEPPVTDQAAAWCRQRGRLVLVGGGEHITVKREHVFAKELDLLISRAGGPGRYDDQYEKLGQDLPDAYVRWTEGRNIAEYVEMVARGQLNVDGLITHRYPWQRAAEAFEMLAGKAKYSAMGVVLTFDA
ncbi:MAG: L-threonine 3-dehydrogenase [Phycisphaerae bacterium]|nr:L-threonine 3-dehydrogenase [Phycisphaerae bacterium]